MGKDLRQLHKEFMKECEFTVKLSPETLRGNQAAFDTLLKLMPHIESTSLSSDMLSEFFKRLDERERKIGKNLTKRGIKKSTVATYRSKLNKFFEWLRIRGYIKENPFNKMAYPSVQYEDRKFLKKEQIEKIFSALALHPGKSFIKKRNVAIFSLLLNSGLRRSELVNLRVYDIDLERKNLFVRSETSKSKRDRTIPLNSSVLPILKDYRDERQKMGYTTSYFFVSSNHDDKLTRDGLKHLVTNLNNISGVDFHLHQFRHTFAVNVLNNGCDIAKLKQLMGHTDIRMTMAYLRCLPTKAMRADLEKLTFANLL
ncbi:MAG: site-specific integrase [Deltaproteobacteria bacterium]|nr:site-specific integrase [Deltaproteobacteria bacterium]